MPRSPPSSSRMAWRNPPSRCMVSKLRIPYVRVIFSKREIGGKYNNISFVAFFTFVDMIFALGCRLSYIFFLFLFCTMIFMNHICILHSEAHISDRRADRRIRENRDLCPEIQKLHDEYVRSLQVGGLSCMFCDTIVIWRHNPSRSILFDFIKWPERDMSDRKRYFKWGAYLLNPPRLIILEQSSRKG